MPTNRGNTSNLLQALQSGGPTLMFKIVGMLLSYAVLFFITNTFGAEIYGRYAIVITVGQVAALVLTLGFPMLIVKLLNDKKHYESGLKTNFLTKIFRLSFVLGVSFSVVFYFTAEAIATHVFGDINYKEFIESISLFFVPLLFHELFLGYFKGLKSFTKHNVFLFLLPSTLFFAWYFTLKEIITSNHVIVLSFGLSITTIFLLESIFFLKKKVILPLKNIKTSFLIKEAFPMMYSAIMLYLLNWTDIFMLESMKSSTDVGIYNAAFKIASICFVFITAINIVISPKIAEYYNNADIKNMHKTIVSYTRFITYLTLPVFLIIIFFGDYILGFFGAEFIQGSTALSIIVTGIFFSALSGNVDQVLIMTRYQKVFGRIVFGGFVLNVILNLILIPTYGINGAAIASLATNVLLNFTCIYFIKKKLGFYTFI
ncbi:flippase [Pseudotenacibaculum haliotis]|uniref:Flippase n=1 Tax=Pseudotenacibaculum haliotis TaxID=1862138 RepID=A0ABW5LPC0_9FLAO